jgi:UDP-N-acetylmuramoyl-L-alanyl-D-glutamate--2,6-diaminopimelate ligase
MFEMLATSYRKPDRPKISILNADDPHVAFFAAFPADHTITYGLGATADQQAVHVEQQPGGIAFSVFDRQADRTDDDFFTPLVGSFNILNSLAAAQVCAALGIDRQIISDAIRQFKGVPGRMERIDAGQPFTALVDFAHTPNSLKNALIAAKTLLSDGGKLIAVFGCAGLRDRDKRRLMPEIAVSIADFCVFTAEDPRTESLDDILAVMAAAATDAGAREGEHFIRLPDRGDALHHACQMGRAGDVVIACGKGHEQSMCFGTTEYPWDDREALRAALLGSPPRNLPTANRV